LGGLRWPVADLRERVARAMCALHGGGRTCEMSYVAADVALREVQAVLLETAAAANTEAARHLRALAGRCGPLPLDAVRIGPRRPKEAT